MKNIKFVLLIVTASILFWSCGEETLDSKSIFDNDEQVMNEFDQWLYTNFTVPYNIEFKYRFDDKESNTNYNLTPARLDKSVALAIVVKHLWIDVYEELLGKEFLSKYSPRLFHLIGSPAYNSQGSIILGTAEGGLKVTLYNKLHLLFQLLKHLVRLFFVLYISYIHSCITVSDNMHTSRHTLRHTFFLTLWN